MAALVLSGDTSGTVSLGAPTVAGTQAYTLPTALPAVTGYGLVCTTAGVMSWGSVSDYRLKNSVQPLTGALDRVLALKPCVYKWNSDGLCGEGFIAHELQSIVPLAASGTKDEINSDGSIKPQTIEVSMLVATLTAAIQELTTKLDESNARIAALEVK